MSWTDDGSQINRPVFTGENQEPIPLRTMLAAYAMHGLCANTEMAYKGTDYIANQAVRQADALLLALSK